MKTQVAFDFPVSCSIPMAPPNAKITLHQRHPTTPSNSLPSGKTNADGRFDVVVTGVSDSKLANGVYLRAEKGTMLALKPLGVFGRQAFVLPEDEYEVGLSEAIEETITVVDMKDRPVPDAKVLVTLGSILMQEQQVSDRNGVTLFFVSRKITQFDECLFGKTGWGWNSVRL